MSKFLAIMLSAFSFIVCASFSLQMATNFIITNTPLLLPKSLAATPKMLSRHIIIEFTRLHYYRRLIIYFHVISL